ncbi:MAG: hypothetical protein Q9213_002745 [Squamulea squamosa]
MDARAIPPICHSNFVGSFGSSSTGWLSNLFKEPKAPEVLQYLQETPNNGLLRYRGMFGAERILVCSAEGLHEALKDKSYILHKSNIAKRIVGPPTRRRALGRGRGYAQAFAPHHIKGLYPTLWRKTTELITALAGEDGGTIADSTNSGAIVNFSVWAARATLDIISVAAFGGDFDSIQNPSTELNNADPDPTKTDVTILSVALRSRSLFNDDDLIDQLMTFLVAGHETTAQFLSWALYHLCKQPLLQTRLREEIRSHLPSPSCTGTEGLRAEYINSLPFLQAICNEILRLMPVIPMVYRQAAGSTTLLGKTIPKGTMIAISPWAFNRSTSLWGPDAHIFLPERWLEDGATERGIRTDNLLTFLHGPRACIGQEFARAELAVLLAGIVGSFELGLVDGTEDVKEVFGLITVKPAGGLRLKVKRVKGW